MFVGFRLINNGDSFRGRHAMPWRNKILKGLTVLNALDWPWDCFPECNHDLHIQSQGHLTQLIETMHHWKKSYELEFLQKKSNFLLMIFMETYCYKPMSTVWEGDISGGHSSSNDTSLCYLPFPFPISPGHHIVWKINFSEARSICFPWGHGWRKFFLKDSLGAWHFTTLCQGSWPTTFLLKVGGLDPDHFLIDAIQFYDLWCDHLL